MRKKLLMANWKMHGDSTRIRALLQEILTQFPRDFSGNCVLFPPLIYLQAVRELIINSSIVLGAQNSYPKDYGAYTGEVATPMLRDHGCRYVLVGHSERRQHFHEDDNFIREKFHHVKDHDMIPVLCVGETLDQRTQGLTQEVLAQQLSVVMTSGLPASTTCVIAYEPVWAIGTGITATPAQAQDVHVFIRNWFSQHVAMDEATLSIIYGGSVNEHNAAALFAMPDIDGALVGGASLHAQQFLEILKCIN